MPISTVTYPSIPSNPSKVSPRHFPILVHPNSKVKARRSFLSDVSTQSTISLPPIKLKEKRSSSIRIDGKQFTGSSSSIHSFRVPSRDAKSRLIRLKFGHPFKERRADFYAPSLTQSELLLRERSFVNDSIRSAHQSRRSSMIPPYDPLKDPYLTDYFQSSFVVDTMRKNLNIDPSERKKRSKTLPVRSEEFRRIVAKKSSGYGKLNGYDCIPSFARRSRQNSVNASFRTVSTDSHHPSINGRRQTRGEKALQPLDHSSPVGQIPSDD